MGGGMGGGQGRGLASGPVPSGLEAGRNSIELNRNGSSELSAALGFGEDRKALAGKALKDDVAWFEKGAQVAQPTPIPARPALGVASVNGVGYVNVDAENLGRLTVRAPAPVKTDTLADGLMAGSITDTRGVTEDRAVRSANLSRSFEGFEAIPAPAPAAASEPMLKQHLGNLSDGATTFTAGPVHDTDFGNGVRITNSPVTALDSSYKSQLLLEQDRFYIPVEALFGQRQDAKSVRDLREMGKLTREKLKEDKPAVESPESRRLNYAIALPQVLEQNLGEKPLRLGGGVINEVNYQQPAQARKPGEQFLELAKGEAGPTRIPDHREELRQKLDSIRVSDLSSDSLPLDEVIKQLDRQVLEFDPNKKGINFLVAKTPEPSAKPTLDPATGLPVTGTLDVLGDLATATIKIDPPLHELTVGQALDVISKSADRPINLSLRGSDVVLSSDKKQAEPSSVRTFTVDPRAFAQGVRSLNALDFSTTQGQGLGGGSGRGGRVTKLVTPMTNSALSVSELLRLHLASAGVSVQTNLHGKSPPITFDDQTGDLMVRAPAQDLELIDQMIKSMNAERKINAPALVGSSPIPQPEVSTANNAFSTFSLNVSDVSFKLAAAALEKGAMPDPAAVRSEEFINAFDYRDPEPKGSAPVAFAWERARYPFAHNRDLLRFSIKTAASGRQPGRPLNLVLLLDNSGSMERSDRVRIIQECLRVLAGQLQPQDRVSVVAFARTARLWIDGLPGSQAGELGQRVGGLTPQGGTNLEEAMNLAYQTALRHFLANGINRVVLLTDGAANLGDVDPVSLKKKVEAHRQQGVALDCFGIGWEGFNDELLESLSRNGDGRYGFVNSPEAAATEFAGQLAGALQVAASDVKVQVEFNPRRVTSYRQIGYAKHQLKKEQFRDNTVDAAEIAAAEAGNALYTVEVNPSGEGPLATVRVRFKVPGTADYREHEWAVPYDGAAKALDQSTATLRLAGTASAFSEWLVSSPFSGEVTPDRLLSLLSGVPEAFAADPRPKKLEWMVRQAKSVAGK